MALCFLKSMQACGYQFFSLRLLLLRLLERCKHIPFLLYECSNSLFFLKDMLTLFQTVPQERDDIAQALPFTKTRFDLLFLLQKLFYLLEGVNYISAAFQ